jgi:hypothetical protein
MATGRNGLSICAIIAARNELHYLNILLPLLAEQRIDVAIIDNESTDGSSDLYAGYLGKPIIMVETIPYGGYFSLSRQLEKKQELLEKIDYDWIIHQDADEIMEHDKPGSTLRDAIQEADEEGYNILNFDEFTFVPEPGFDYSRRNYYTGLLRYYFFEPRKNRLNRAWKRASRLSNIASGGHILCGDAPSISPINHILRHYIVLGERHAEEKYLARNFDELDLRKGWHGNRLQFTKNNLRLPEKSSFLFRLSRHDSKDFCRTNPTSKHFWEWK